MSWDAIIGGKDLFPAGAGVILLLSYDPCNT